MLQLRTELILFLANLFLFTAWCVAALRRGLLRKSKRT